MTTGQSCESDVSSRQLTGPLAVWQLIITCLIALSLSPKSAIFMSRMPFFLGSTLAILVIVVPGGGASTSSAGGAFGSVLSSPRRQPS